MPKSSSFSTFRQNYSLTFIGKITAAIVFVALVGVTGVVGYKGYQRLMSSEQALTASQQREQDLAMQLDMLQEQVSSASARVQELEEEDPRPENKALQAEILQIQTTLKGAATTYENLYSFKDTSGSLPAADKLLAQALLALGNRNWASASALLKQVESTVEQQRAKLAATAAPIAANVPVNNTPPANGYQRQAVNSDAGQFQVDVLAADLNSTRVVVETAASEDCRDNCPVDSLSSFVGKAGGFAGINGPYFCPAEYPSCAGKTNSYDTLIMNKDKKYFNSDNNVYSNVPAVIFSGSSARFVGATQEWGRDTGVDSVIASQPLLLSGGDVRFGGDGDPKKGSRGNRSFIGTKGSTVYIGVVRSATVAEVARVLKAMGLENALNLDSGGSTAFMAGGRYVAGPGRNTPFGIVLVRK